MKKKVLVILLVLVLAMSTVFAANTKGTTAKNSFGIGLNAGTNSGLALRFGMGKFDLQGDVGFALIGKGLNVDFGAAFNFANVQFNDGARRIGELAFTTGPMAGLLMKFSPFEIALDIDWVMAMSYEFAQIPLSLYLRLGGGVTLAFVDSKDQPVIFGGNFTGALGVLWTF